MDKTNINEIILYLRKSLIESGLNDLSIAIFGSALKGNMTENSDIDLVIISNLFENKSIFDRAKLTMIPELDTLKKFKIPMDVLNLTPNEYENSNFHKFYESKIVT